MHLPRHGGPPAVPPAPDQPASGGARSKRLRKVTRGVAAGAAVSLMCGSALAMASGHHISAHETRDAAAVRPVLSITGEELRWTRVPSATRYVVAATRPGAAPVAHIALGAHVARVAHKTTYRVVKTNSFRPSAVPGRRAVYRVRAKLADARWTNAVTIAWPSLTKAMVANVAPVLSVSAPVLSVSGAKISWSAQAGATTYKGATSTAAVGAASRTTSYLLLGTATSWTPSAQPGKTAYYGVASEGSPNELWSNEAAISWNAPPVLSLSNGTVSWPTQGGATGYRASVSTAPVGTAGRTTTYQELGKVTSWTPTAPQPGQMLYYGVASEGPSGVQSTANEVSITTPKPSNAAPNLTLSNGKITWAAQSGATGYRAAVSTAPAGSASRTTTYQELGNVTSWTPTPPAPGQTLYYGVASEGPAGDQWTANEVSITTPQAQQSAQNTSPVLTLSNGKITWAAQSGATGSRTAVSTAPAGPASRTTTYQELGNVTSWTPTPPAPGQTLYYGVASEGPAGDQWTANEVSITTPPSSNPSPPSSMVVGLNGGWGQTSAADMAGTFASTRLDTSVGGTEIPSTYNAKGIKVIVMIPGTCPSCGYSTGGVSAINASSWASSALSFFQSQCNGSTANCPGLEVLNEPSGSWFWGSNATSQANESAYANLLQTVWNTFHNQYGSNSPKILAAYDSSSWWNGVQSANPNIGNYYDGIVVHPYGGGCGHSTTESALGSRDVVTAAHSTTGKPVWATEVGWPTATGQSCTGDSLQWTETQQANNIYNFVSWARSTGYVDAVMYFNYRDYGTNMWYGLERSGESGSTVDGSKKPGWYALAEAARGEPCTVC